MGDSEKGEWDEVKKTLIASDGTVLKLNKFQLQILKAIKGIEKGKRLILWPGRIR